MTGNELCQCFLSYTCHGKNILIDGGLPGTLFFADLRSLITLVASLFKTWAFVFRPYCGFGGVSFYSVGASDIRNTNALLP
jgi:hypothetical protein